MHHQPACGKDAFTRACRGCAASPRSCSSAILGVMGLSCGACQGRRARPTGGAGNCLTCHCGNMQMREGMFEFVAVFGKEEELAACLCAGHICMSPRSVRAPVLLLLLVCKNDHNTSPPIDACSRPLVRWDATPRGGEGKYACRMAVDFKSQPG